MTTEDQWIGNLGHLALADAMLGALLIDMLEMLVHADYPDAPPTVDRGSTTKQAAQKVRSRLRADLDLFGPSAERWLEKVLEVAEARNELLHAVALNQCDTCGGASQFMHPRSGKEVDRSDGVVHDLTERAWALRTDGLVIAEDISQRVNTRIEAYARRVANETNEIQGPPQVYPHHVTRRCANCDANGKGSVTVQLGRAVEVWPTERFRAMVDELRDDSVGEQ